MNIPLRIVTLGSAILHLVWCSTSFANHKVCWYDANGKADCAVVAGKCGDYQYVPEGGFTCKNLAKVVKVPIERGANGRAFVVLDGAKTPIASDAVVKFFRNPKKNRTQKDVQEFMKQDDGRVSAQTIRQITEAMKAEVPGGPKRNLDKAKFDVESKQLTVPSGTPTPAQKP